MRSQIESDSCRNLYGKIQELYFLLSSQLRKYTSFTINSYGASQSFTAILFATPDNFGIGRAI